MAVTRITAPTIWHQKAAHSLTGMPSASRELLRAAKREGLTAELRAEEVRALAKVLPEDNRVVIALQSVMESEHRERFRPMIWDMRDAPID